MADVNALLARLNGTAAKAAAAEPPPARPPPRAPAGPRSETSERESLGMPRISWDIDQGSVDWYKLRATVPTASRFHEIITPKTMKMSATRKKYACQIIAARLLNWQADSLDKIDHIKDGKEKEPIAVAQLELIREIETRKVGFVRTGDGRFGASPDRVLMNGDAIRISVECKCPTIPTQMEYLLRAELAAMEPPSSDVEVYRCQRQGQLFVTDAEEAIFFSYQERMPHVYERAYRDEPFIRKLRDALEQFSDELCALEERARSLGAYQAFAEILPPSEIEIPTDADVQRAVDANYQWGG